MGVLIYISEVSSGDSGKEGRKRSIFRLSCLFSVIHIGALNSHRNSDSINLESKSLCTSVFHLHATNQEHLGQTDRQTVPLYQCPQGILQCVGFQILFK